MRNKKLVIALEIALVSAVSYVLSLIPFFQFGNFFEIYIGVIPVIVFSYRRGVGPGMLAGLLWGALLIITGQIYALTPVQVVLEYLVAFAANGLSGLASQKLKSTKNPRQTIFWSTALSVGAKYLIHFFAGYIFWKSYAPEGMNPWLYSLLFNGTSALLTFIVAYGVISSSGINLKRLINVK